LASIDTLSAGVLEDLAAQYDLTAWDSAWPISTKRAVLKTAIADKRKKGTRGAVQRAIEAVAPLATITEWWQKTPKGAPHTFEIDVLQDGEAVDAETVADVIAQVNDSKPVRSHFTFSVGQQSEGNMYLSGVIRTIAYARVRSSGMTAVQTEIDAGVLAALRGMNIRRIMEFSHMGEMPEPTPTHKEWKAYFNSNKSDFTLNYIGSYAYLYDSTGHTVRYRGSTAVFTLVQVYKENGEVGTVSYGVNTYEANRFIANFGINSNHAMQYWYSATSLTGTVNYLTYTIDPEPKAAYITVDKTVSDMSSGTWYALYDESGNQIVGDNSKSYYLFIITSDTTGTQKDLSYTLFNRINIMRRSDGYLYIASVGGAITSVYQVIYIEES
jgi:phage tail P2-like protein